jgi:hypothetical protein
MDTDTIQAPIEAEDEAELKDNALETIMHCGIVHKNAHGFDSRQLARVSRF